jgi:hypothetical protein
MIVALRCFNGDFSDWLDFRVLQTLIGVFSSEHAKTRIQGKVARLLANLIAFSNTSNPSLNTTAYLLDSPLSSDIILLLQQHNY